MQTHQHSGTEVKFIKELGDKDVVLHKSFGVSFLNITDDVSKPFVLLLCTSCPDEKYLHRKKRK